MLTPEFTEARLRPHLEGLGLGVGGLLESLDGSVFQPLVN